MNTSVAGYCYQVAHDETGEGAGRGSPNWQKTNNKLYVIAYPSDQHATMFLADASSPRVHTAGAGYGIFVEPRKQSRAKFWKGRQDTEPTLFTLEGVGGIINVRKGLRWGINGMLVRFLIESTDQEPRTNEVQDVLSRVAFHEKAGNERWLREALLALIEAGLLRSFHVEEFVDIAKGVVSEQLIHGAEWDRVTTVDYEDHIKKSATRDL